MKVLLAALALLLVVALAQPGAAQLRSVPRFARVPSPCPGLPSAEIQAAAKAAADEYGVPLLLLYAVAWVESGYKLRTKYKHNATNSKVWRDSYNLRRNWKIPGSTITWGQKFRPEDWHPYGLMQVNPYGIWGATLAAGAPIEAGFELTSNMRAGARALRLHFDKGKTWIKALWGYNAKVKYRNLVLDAYRALGGSLATLEGGNS